MTTVYETEGYVVLTLVDYNGTPGAPGSTISWSGLQAENDANLLINDVEPENGLMDAGVDFFGAPQYDFSGYTITVDGVEYPVFNLINGTPGFVPLPVDGTTQTLIPESGTSNEFQAQADTYMCFAAGTGIACPGGERAVETLEIGDTVLTADGRAVPVRWIGRQTVDKRFTPAERFAPVRVAAGALGGGLPERDLVLTADHALVLDGLAITAGALVNGTTICRVPMAELAERETYYHVETDDHEAILAEGAAAETFVECDQRRAFDNHAEYVALYGAERGVAEMALPRVSSARLVPAAIRARLGIVEAA